MKINPSNTDYQEFLDIISGIRTIETYHISINYEDTIIGSLDELNELAENTNLIELKKYVFELNQKANYEMSSIEVMVYLKELTKDFEFDFVKLALFELDVFQSMVFNEALHEKSMEAYIKNEWEIPQKKIKDFFTKEFKDVYDYEAMAMKAFPFLGLQLYEAKRMLENKLKNFTEPQSINKHENRTKQVITEAFEKIDNKGWEYAFVSEKDYILFTDILTNFFECKSYSLPKTTIKLKRTCKTKIAKVLGEIHKELSNENKLSTDNKYFELIRVLSHFENEVNANLYKALTR